MKAKDYYVFFKDELAKANEVPDKEKSADHRATEKLIQKMVSDMLALAKTRRVDLQNHPERLEPLVKQFNSIWNAMRKLDPTFRRDGFEAFCKNLSKDKGDEKGELG